MSTRNHGWSLVAPDIYRLDVADVNCYLVVTSGGMTLIDAGLPGTTRVLEELLLHLGARVTDIDAVVLTHGHFDHVGMARQFQSRRTPILVHAGDQPLARHPYRYAHESSRLPYLFRPRAMPIIARMTRNGALAVKGVHAEPQVRDGEVVDVPGRPVALWTPGHTAGHCGYFLPDQGVLISGDAIVTLDPYTGARGPRIVANAATADSDEALRSIGAFESSDARVVLPGHGDPWQEGIRTAVAAARRAGKS